ncbi:MAG: phosphodiesterase [Rhodospirillales bacterium]|nr:phosphodiesterase [Rhodospirillales bacterium]MDE2197530.1 phosphodiesterase [Rhodospirillales bacterium]MDE2575731.1 phosphodiesterase [Rhodospirillales bacterium]
MILIQLTDLHCRPHGQPAMRTCETNMLAERAMRAVRNFRPRADAVVITGDLTDGGTGPEYDEVAAILGRTLLAEGLAVYVIPGNHDRREVLRDRLGHLPGVLADPEFVQYVVDDLPVRLVMLDTVVPGAAHGVLCPRRLAWLDATLAAAPDKPTMLGMHHPPFACGIRLMDTINLHEPNALAAILSKHRQVRRIICGHHHRPITAPFGRTIASIAPSVAHQVELTLHSDQPNQWNLEPAAFDVHIWLPDEGPDGAIVSHTAYVEPAPGPYPFLAPPEYPGRAL